MDAIKVKNNKYFTAITSKMDIYTTFKFTPRSVILEYKDINQLINRLQFDQNHAKIMINNFTINEKQLLFLLIFENKIYILDEINFEKYKSIFKKIQSSFYFLNNKLEEELFILSSKSDLNLIKKEDLLNFNQDELSFIQTQITNAMIMRSQVLTQQRHNYIDSITIDLNAKYKFEDFVRIKLFQSNIELCYNLNDQLLYILKTFDKNEKNSNKLYQRELTFYNTISNKNKFICKFFGTIQEQKKNAIIIEYVDGKTLEEFILDSKNKITSFEKIKIILEIIMTTEFIHLNDLVLRDLKWDNIVIDSNQNAIFIDFDRSRKLIEDENPEKVTKDFGCECFLSPEQFLKGEFSFKSDIFTLGIIIHLIINEKQYNESITMPLLSDLYKSGKSILSIQSVSLVPDEFKFLFESYKNCFEFNPDQRPNITELFYRILLSVNSFFKKKIYSITYDLYNVRMEQLREIFKIFTYNQKEISCNIEKFVNYLKIASNFNDSYAQYFLGRMYILGKYVPSDLNKGMNYLNLSAQHNSYAQLLLSNLYEQGDYFPINIQKSIDYLTCSANQNNKYAQMQLGVSYLNGQNVNADIEKAFHYLTLAADQKESLACLYLSTFYLDGPYKRDTTKGLHYLNIAIEQKHPHAFYCLGMMYHDGIGVKTNINKSIEYLTKAADMNVSDAQYYLGRLYYEGKSVTRDVKKSIYYLEKSSDLNNHNAQWYLGRLYYLAYYTPRNIEKSIYYLKLSAKQNNHDAEYILGIIYMNGKYIEPDINQSIYYLQLASDSNNSDAQKALGLIYFQKKYNKYDIKKAIHYFTLCSKQQPTIYCILGAIYYNKNYVVQDIFKAIYCFEIAAKNNDMIAYYFLGLIYYNGQGIKRDMKKAVHYFSVASNSGEDLSQYMLGIIYYNGDGVERDVNEAIRLLTLSSKSHNIEAEFALGKIYCFGKYIKNDINKGIHYLTLASNHGVSEAQYNLGLIYFDKKYVKQNIRKAVYYLKMAAENNNRDAQLYLGTFYYYGDYIHRNVNIAIHYYKEISSFNDYRAKNNLGIIYLKGEFVKKNVYDAIMYFEEAIKFGDMFYSFYNLARIYYFGFDVEKDFNKAIGLLEKVVENRFFFAVLILASISLVISNDQDKANKYLNILKSLNSNAYICYYEIFNNKKENYFLANIFIQFFKTQDLIYPYSDKIVIDFFNFLECEKYIEKDNTSKNNKKAYNMLQSNITNFFYDGFLN